MAIRAYDESYVSAAQNTLGHAVDFAVLTLKVDPNEFGTALAVSNAGRQLAKGNPRYAAGMNGCEFTRSVLEEVRLPFTEKEDILYLDKSPEYWAGWALAFFQWQSNYSFADILKAIPLSLIIRMYPVYHEMDILQFTDRIRLMMQEKQPHTNLRARREICGFSQSELAKTAGVPIRQVQLFEQRERDINKTAAITLLRLGKALHCEMEDLIER